MSEASVLIVDRPGAIEVLAYVDTGLSVATVSGAGRDLQDEIPELHSVVGGDGALIAEGDDLLDVEPTGSSKSDWGCGSITEAPVKSASHSFCR